MKKTTVYLDGGPYQALKQLAARSGRAPAALVREAVAEYAAKHAARRRPRSIGAGSTSRGDLSERAEELLAGFGADSDGSHRRVPRRGAKKERGR